jgi:ABC-2 type transport system ATP-binding protein
VIRVEHLVKKYGSHLAVDDLSFEVGRGEVVGFLGPNGAGKSTTLRVLAGFLGMTSGRVEVAGYDIEQEADEAKRHIGYMPEAVPLYPEMRVAEYLAFRAELKRVPRAERKSSVERAMDEARVADRATALIGHLSKGYRQRVGLADALVANPPLLILDEPTAGLDPNQIREVRALIKGLGKNHTVLLSTHILSEVEQSCSRAVLIDKGKLVAQGTIKEIRSLRRSPGLDLRLRGEVSTIEKVLGEIPNIAKIKQRDGDLWRCTWPKKASDASIAEATEAVVAALVSAGISVREVKPAESSLEDVFTQLTTPAAEEP